MYTYLYECTSHELVMLFAAEARNQVKEELKKKRIFGRKIRMCLDKYTRTSKQNRTYSNVCIQCQDEEIFNLGMVYVKGTMPSEKVVALVKQRLPDFDLSLEMDISGVTTDGAAVMVALVKTLLHFTRFAWLTDIILLFVMFSTRGIRPGKSSLTSMNLRRKKRKMTWMRKSMLKMAKRFREKKIQQSQSLFLDCNN